MPSLSEEGDPGDNRTFSSFNNMKRRDIILWAVLGVFVLFILRNMMIRDYESETKSYLTSIGRKDAIDNVIPKTTKQLIQEKMDKDKMIEIMAKNVTFLMSEYKALRSEVDLLKPKPST